MYDLNFPEKLKKNDRLLLESAVIMNEYSKEYCCTADLNCEWYHSSWSYARLVDIAITPNLLKNQFNEYFLKLDKLKDFKILICGTANYEIILHLLEAIPKELMPRMYITIIDICKTPLKICKWFIERENININVNYVQCDILNFNFKNDKFDLITSYSFLQRFDKEKRIVILRKWNSILNYKGSIITTARISFEKPQKLNFFQYDFEYFKNEISSYIKHYKPWLLPISEAISISTYKYVSNIYSYPIGLNQLSDELSSKLEIKIMKNVIKTKWEGEKIYTCITLLKV